jgi:adenosylcobinamide kinase / adenosylcobinamide-phosphate guanylyltransferase
MTVAASPETRPAPAAGLAPGATLVLGGARSGKSRLAEAMVLGAGRRAVYLATGRAFDGEMETRIADHQARRGPEWQSVDVPLDLVPALRRHAAADTAILVDCLTLWITNLMLEGRDVPRESDALVALLAAGLAGPVVLVSNEVGLGIVPDNAMARAFRDHAGRLHQSIAAIAGRVLFVAAGLPLTLKG